MLSDGLGWFGTFWNVLHRASSETITFGQLRQVLNDIEFSGVNAQRTSLEEAKSNLPGLIRKILPSIANGYNFTPEILVERLFQISTSTTLSEVRSKEPTVDKHFTSPLVVLLLGWGGSGVHDLEPIADFYATQGATVIFTTPMGHHDRIRTV